MLKSAVQAVAQERAERKRAAIMRPVKSNDNEKSKRAKEQKKEAQ